MKDVIKNGILVFEVDDGIKKTTDCKVNMRTKEIYDCNLAMMFDGWKLLNNEYLVIDGEFYSATGTSADYRTNEDYWYDDI